MGAKYLPTVRDQRAAQRFHKKQSPGTPIQRTGTPASSRKTKSPRTPKP